MGKKSADTLSDDFVNIFGPDFTILEDLVVNNPYAIGVFDKDGHCLFVNNSFLQYFQVFPPRDYSVFHDPYLKQNPDYVSWIQKVQEGKVYDIPELWYNLKGNIPNAPDKDLCFHVAILPVRVKTELKFYGIMIEDITVKVTAENELAKYRDHLEELVKEREAKLSRDQEFMRNFIDHNPYAIGIFDKEGSFVQGNKAYMNLLKILPPNEFNLFSPTMRKVLGEDYEKLFKMKQGEKIIFDDAWYDFSKIQSIYPQTRLGLRVTLFPLIVVNNEPENFVVMIEDVSKKMEYQEEIAKKDTEVQYFGIISMISSMFIHDITKIDENINKSLNSLGDSINCNAVLLFQHNVENKVRNFRDRWNWIPKDSKMNLSRLEQLLSQSYLIDYAKELPMNLFFTEKLVSSAKFPEITTKLISELNIHSLLLVPVFVGKDRFGTLVLTLSDPSREFYQKEIQLSLNVGIIIGLALKNITNQQFMGNFFEALGNLEAGIFISQVDPQGNFHIVYVNTYASKMIGMPIELIYQQTSFFDFIEEEDVPFIQGIYKSRYIENNQNIPTTYKVRVKTEHGPRTMQMAISAGKYNDKPATYGLLVEWHQIQKLKSVQEIFEEFVQDSNRKK